MWWGRITIFLKTSSISALRFCETKARKKKKRERRIEKSFSQNGVDGRARDFGRGERGVEEGEHFFGDAVREGGSGAGFPILEEAAVGVASLDAGGDGGDGEREICWGQVGAGAQRIGRSVAEDVDDLEADAVLAGESHDFGGC